MNAFSIVVYIFAAIGVLAVGAGAVLYIAFNHYFRDDDDHDYAPPPKAGAS